MPNALNARVDRWLQHTNPLLFNTFAIVAAFGTYACMYMYRKPFAVAEFPMQSLGGIEFQSLLVITQIIGYALSKFIGIKVIAETRPGTRVRQLLLLIGAAELALLGFALVPYPYNFPFLFVNGLMLGMIWGLVFGFLEGRTHTEILAVGLSTSFIVASGWAKTLGKWLLSIDVSPFWMPFTAGLIVMPALLLFAWMLSRIPQPSEKDIAERTARVPMNAAQRRGFVREFALGLILLVVGYVLLTAFRDFRDNFMANVWTELNVSDPSIFSKTETAVGLFCVLFFAPYVLFKRHLLAMQASLLTIVGGMLLVAGATFAYQRGALDPQIWMILIGIGLYLGYIPFNSFLFDRLIAAFRSVGNAGFLIYVADAFGYAGAVAAVLYKNFGVGEISWLRFTIVFGYVMAAIVSAMMLGAMLYFWRKGRGR